MYPHEQRLAEHRENLRKLEEEQQQQQQSGSSGGGVLRRQKTTIWKKLRNADPFRVGVMVLVLVLSFLSWYFSFTYLLHNCAFQ